MTRRDRVTRFAKGARRKAEGEQAAQRGERRQRWNDMAYTLVIWLWRVGVPVFVAAVGPLILADLGPAWSARFGSGTPGTYTALYEDCDGSKRCVWRGTFVSDDGSLRRTDVGLGTGVGLDHVGQAVPAVDTGNRINVYPVGGGWDWILILLVSAVILAIVVMWARGIVSAVRAKLAERGEEMTTRSRMR